VRDAIVGPSQLEAVDRQGILAFQLHEVAEPPRKLLRILEGRFANDLVHAARENLLEDLQPLVTGFVGAHLQVIRFSV